MTAQTPGGGAAEEQEPKKPKVKPANWHPTGVGETGDGPRPVVPQPGEDLDLSGTAVTTKADPKDGGTPKPDNWHPTTEPANP